MYCSLPLYFIFQCFWGTVYQESISSIIKRYEIVLDVTLCYYSLPELGEQRSLMSVTTSTNQVKYCNFWRVNIRPDIGFTLIPENQSFAAYSDVILIFEICIFVLHCLSYTPNVRNKVLSDFSRMECISLILKVIYTLRKGIHWFLDVITWSSTALQSIRWIKARFQWDIPFTGTIGGKWLALWWFDI